MLCLPRPVQLRRAIWENRARIFRLPFARRGGRPASFLPIASGLQCAPHKGVTRRHATGLQPTRPRHWSGIRDSWRSRLPSPQRRRCKELRPSAARPHPGVARRRFGIFPSLTNFPCVRDLLLCFLYWLLLLHRPPSMPGRTPTTAIATHVMPGPATDMPAAPPVPPRRV